MTEMTWKKAIIKVLTDSKKSLHYTEIAEKIAENKYRTSLGATPQDTVNSQITVDLKQNGTNSIFCRTEKGYYTLRILVSEELLKQELTQDEVVPNTALINNFGIYWNRDLIDWRTTPSMFGVQLSNSDPIDFKKQIGVYLLHDVRETVYVGQATGQSLGERLYVHTKDRLNSRWNRFSWFGFYPVTKNGNLNTDFTFEQVSIAQFGNILEAVLIESIEPRLNRKQGNLFYGSEYIQYEAPEITKLRKHKILQELITKI